MHDEPSKQQINGQGVAVVTISARGKGTITSRPPQR